VLPKDRVLITARESFAVQPDGPLERNERDAVINLGHATGIGWRIRAGETCAVMREAADVLVGEGYASPVKPT
jgi:hypothetical protein